jgi:hypothetical protein
MKDISLGAVAVLVVLLPGFFAARLVQSLTNRKKQSDFDKVVEALVYSFVVYVLYSLWGFGLPIEWSLWRDPTGIDHYLVNLHSNELLGIGGISLVLALLLAAVGNHDLSGKFFRFLSITRNTARPTIWSDAFHEYQGFVQVELKDGRHVIGWVLRYSGDPEQSTLFLSHAHWHDVDYGNVPIPGKGILLTKSTGIKYVMFLDTPKKAEPTANLPPDAAQASAARGTASGGR